MVFISLDEECSGGSPSEGKQRNKDADYLGHGDVACVENEGELCCCLQGCIFVFMPQAATQKENKVIR